MKKQKTTQNFIFTISLFFIQLCIASYTQHQKINLLLIYYIWTLLYQYSCINLIFITFFAELISFMQFGVFGLAIICLSLLSYAFYFLRKIIHKPLIVPCIFICSYQLLHELFLYIIHAHPVSPLSILCNCIINCSIFSLIWFYKKLFLDKN